MHTHPTKRTGTMLAAALVALAGCSGSRGPAGDVGPTGPAGQDLTATAKAESCVVCHADSGSEHQAVYDTYAGPTTLAATIDSVASTANGDGTFTSVLTVSIQKDGKPVTDATLLKQKTFWAVQYLPGTTGFTTNTAFSYSGLAAVAGVDGQYTVKNAAAPFAPEDAANDAFIAAYVAMGEPIVNKGHYKLYPDVYNFGKAFGAAVVGDAGYVSTANVSACEACHGKPYQKHGYRGAVAVGLNDFVACKACHTDQRGGTDFNLVMAYDDPAALIPVLNGPKNEEGDPIWGDLATKYAYTATVMNDTHMSHAMEFAYPQSMANCVTCHEGKLDRILTDANFTLATCKSCHPVEAKAGESDKRAPALKGLMTASTLGYKHATQAADLYTYAGNCNGCHSATGSAPTFAQLHGGYNKAIYADATTKYASSISASVESASFDATTNKATVKFKVTGAATNALVKPTVVVSLYGYGTKDFVVSGHSSQFSDKTPNLEWSEGAVIRGTTTPANTNRLTVSPATATAGNASWTATADLSTWADLLASGEVKAIEIGFLPVLGLDQTQAVSATNPAIAITGVTQTVDVSATAADARTTAYGKAIVDTAKCNACHDALGTTFHSPSYGSAGVVACRLCHFVGAGGSHLEMQSRSIDSYVHAIHSFQAFDVGGIDFADPVAAFEYEEHVGSTYPNFTIMNCESCHNAGTYDVAAQDKSLPSILSASATNASWDRTITGVPVTVTGPNSRACGSCHRSQMIVADDAAGLASFNDHAGVNGYMLEATSSTSTSVWTAAFQKIMSYFK